MTTSFPPLSLRDILSSPSQIGESLSDSLVTAVGGLVTITEGDIHGASALQGIKLVPESRSPGTQKATDIISFLNDGSEGYKATGSPSFLPDRTHENKPPEAEPSNSTTVASDDSSTNRHGLECVESLPGLSLEENWFFDYEIFDKSTDWLRGWGDWPAAPQKEGQANNCALSDLNHSTTPGAVPNLTITAGVGSSKRVASPVSVCSDEGSLFKIKHHDDHQTRLPAVRPIKDHNSVEDFLPWGWQSSREKLERRVTLPPLRQILEELTPQTPTVTQACSPANVNKDESWVDDRILNDMVSLLSIPVERFPYESADMSKFPSKTMIDSFIKIYFEQFHSILPMIHKPTFSAGTCPTIVLVAMASIGASYSHLEGAKMFADSLSELCKRTLTWMAEHNPEYPHSDFFLMASCLQSVYALGSGSHRLYDCADVSRSALIGSARRIGLFSGRVSPPSSSPGSAPGSPNPKTTRDEDNCNEKEAIEVRWRRWYVKEKLRRLAWSIFEYDCSFSTLSNRRGAITLNDISTRMPCAEALWQAPTAQAWGALLESGVLPPGAEKGTPFYPTLRDVISGKMSPENLTSWGRRLCAQAIGRILWDFKELEESVLSESSSAGNDGGLGLPMLSPGLKPAKEKLLKSLMVICEGVRERQMEAGWRDGEVDGDRAHMTLALLISHYTHLHAAFPTVSLILSLARRPPSPTTTLADPRITRLKTIFQTDPVYARTLAWNAAQIITISRWKPVCSPVEGMRIFMAGVVLWGFGRYFREPLPPGPLHSNPLGGVREEVVRLDSQPWKGVDDWIKKGKGKATIGSDQHAGNAMTEICSEMGAKEVLRVVVGILGRMRAWGLGGEFKNVLEEMVRRS
ncbi:fungal-specific transcription factor domain-domain-containing protein [Tuber borchii]|uniref:Fungal-specific transcription factor domain-domain-containing protein n=1 Tax=Tuber borchii TaxID=42251 RepID=A0A2T6ZSW4_TUBBO|nr:fungal-specific transcription factor domain-domain-containing protein [Tuber borchii]